MPGKLFSRKLLTLIAVAYVTTGVGVHADACEERARILRRDLAWLERKRVKYGQAQWGQHHEYAVLYWYGVRLFNEEEARQELLLQQNRARLLKTWSPLHLLRTLPYDNE